MATIGDLVVNLTANSANFQRTMAESQAITKRFAASSAQAGATAANGFGRAETSVIKLGAQFIALQAAVAALRGTIGGVFAIIGTSIRAAAGVETLSTQFEVLTGDAETAKRVLGDITELAASTPFQKAELADAGRKLLAFGTDAAQVQVQLRQIGDIAALTGNSVTELAEIYGKAQVQGRLFADDIRQLTGRGIPIIQELAKQFGVTEDAVTKLVSEGQVGFENLQQAFAAMTSEGGKFAGGMERLATTTAGKWSTLKDNLMEIAVVLGERLLPSVNAFVDTVLKGFQEGSPAMEALDGFVSKLDQIGGLLEGLEGGLGLGAGINLNKIAEVEAKRIEERNAEVVRKNKQRALKIVEDREQAQAAPQVAAVVPGVIPEATIGAVASEMADIVPSAIVEGFHDAGRLIPEPEAAVESAAKFAGAAEAGSAEAFSSIVRNVFGTKRNPQVEEQQKTNRLLQEQNGLLNKSFFNTATVEAFA